MTPFGWAIDAVDENGVPTRAHCQCYSGAYSWVRPDHDRTGETLLKVAHWHLCHRP